jgi:Do/DeqQ family serine protease
MKKGAIITLFITLFVIAAILFYIPYMVENINYHRTSGELRAYKENLAAMQKGDTLSPLFHSISATIRPAVVVVQVSEKIAVQPQENPDENDFLRWFFGEQGAPYSSVPNTPPEYLYKEGLGSGIIIDANQGYILTNWHVVHGADKINVTLSDGRIYSTKWVRSDSKTDLAVIKIDVPDLIAAPLGDSNKMQTGDLVLAIGAPEGLPHTVTSGIISAKGRTTSDGYETFLQTDAAINPGNSGGPLVNMLGQVIGVNTAIVSAVGANEGIGLSIPSNTAKIVMKQLIEKGKVTRGYIGIEIEDANEAIVKKLGLPNQNGALVVKVTPDSPAQAAGLKPDDFIISVNDKSISNSFDLLSDITSISPGQKATIGFYHNGKKETATVEINKLPEQEAVKEILV